MAIDVSISSAYGWGGVAFMLSSIDHGHWPARWYGCSVTDVSVR